MPEKNIFTLRFKLSVVSILTTLIPLVVLAFIQVEPIFYLLIAFPTTIISSFVLFYLITPLSNLVKGFNGLSSGDLNYRMHFKSGDEFEEIANSYNMMANKVAILISATQKDRTLISAERNRLNTILSSITDGIIALDVSKNIMLANKAAEFMCGFSQIEMKGRNLDDFLKLYAGGEQIFAKNVCEPQFNQSAVLVSKNGKQTRVNISTVSAAEEVQTDLGCILILQDLSKEEELERMKLDFVSMASHELKTPLTSITGYLSVFIKENQTKVPKEELELLEKSLVSAKQLYSLVTNLLSVNKIEREQLSFFTQAIDYSGVLKKAIDDLQNQAKLKNITLSLNTPPQLPKILADQVRISEVLDNLIANAINYTNSGGSVTVNVTTKPTEVITSVEDTGIGIPQDAIPNLFTKFFRVSNTSQQASKGTGLGLFISRSIIEKLGGKIWAESEVGKGSKFIFTVPAVSSISQFDSANFARETIQEGGLNY
jgi:PAS domain S-box-containing protein